MPFDSLAKEIAETKYFCLTSSWFENAPVSIIEAVALNIIPLVPDFGGMKESVVEVCNAGVIYKNGSIESWIDGITKLENNYTSELHKIILARANIFQNYSVEKYVEQLIELYNKE
jgi:glycosyltransferase involved in cell wall biosynthesis